MGTDAGMFCTRHVAYTQADRVRESPDRVARATVESSRNTAVQQVLDYLKDR